MRLIDADELLAECGNCYTEEGVLIKDLVEKMPTIITVDWRRIPRRERQPDKSDWYAVLPDNGSATQMEFIPWMGMYIRNREVKND